MPTYIGFSTVNANKPRSTNMNQGIDSGVGGTSNPIIIGKKHRLLDQPLVVQDFINALNIPQGQKVGQPSYGTTIWSFIFEPNNSDTQFQIENEIKRVAESDPRMIINSVRSYPEDHGILIEVELAIAPFNDAQILSILFDQALGTASAI